MGVSDQLKKRIEQTALKREVNLRTIGRVAEVGDGVAWIRGLTEALMGELLDFGKGIFGVVFNLEESRVGAIIYGDYTQVSEGREVALTGKVLEVPVGEALIGRVVDALGRPIDGKGPIETRKTRVVERIAPGVMMRAPVNTPVQTGIMAIDSMIPIGRGQRELIIGDRSTGKTAIAVDTIINQRDKDLVCIYVAVGQRRSNIAKVVAKLKEMRALRHTIVVSASASDPVSLQYLAPYAGCAMGEEFLESGKEALVVYDDLTKHAWAYRQISLILRRPPGREAYPGDVFYLHSRLLERACKLDERYGGGSLTALPIVETQAGDVAAYIPTNIISITDGQIYLDIDLFNAGVRPAINVGLSVSRVGGAAQIKVMKQVAGRLRLDIAQYRELAAFAQFGSDLDEETLVRLERGKRVTELLKQPQYSPLPVITQVALLFAATEGCLDAIPFEKIPGVITGFREHFEDTQTELIRRIEKEDELSDKTREQLRRVIEDFKLGFK